MATKKKARKHKRYYYHICEIDGTVIPKGGAHSVSTALMRGYRYARKTNLELDLVKGGRVVNGKIPDGDVLVTLTSPK